MNVLFNTEIPRIELGETELSQVSAGEFNRFVNFGDIKGESTEKDHKDWVTILDYHH